MISKIVKSRGSGFRKAANYLITGKAPTSGTRGTIIGSNMAGRTPRELAREFASFRKLRPALGRAVFHASLSLSPEDRKLGDDEFADLGQRYLAEMGFGECPFVIVRHHDTDHPHIHLLASRITPSGGVVSDKHDFKRSEDVARKLETAFGLMAVASSTPKKRRPSMNPDKKKAIEARLEASSQQAEAEHPAATGTMECTPFSPSDKERTSFKRRLLEDEYEQEVADTLADDCAYIHRTRHGLFIHTRDGGLIVDKGDRITANKMTDKDAASRVIALAVAKGWRGIELTGSRDFVRHAMREALRAGLAVSPKDSDQREVLEEIMREIGRGGDGEHEIEARPSFAKRLRDRRQQIQAPAPVPQRGPKGGIL